MTTELGDEESLVPWLALESNSVKLEHWPIKRQHAGIDTDRLVEMLSKRTRLVVMSKASSAVGSIVELLPVALGVQGHESSLLVNWSAFLPHGAIDVRFLRSDFLIASTRFFFGANVGFLWGSRERMRSLRADAPELLDGASVEPKTLAGFGAALSYIEELGLITEQMQLQPSEDYGRRGTCGAVCRRSDIMNVRSRPSRCVGCRLYPVPQCTESAIPTTPRTAYLISFSGSTASNQRPSLPLWRKKAFA